MPYWHIIYKAFFPLKIRPFLYEMAPMIYKKSKERTKNSNELISFFVFTLSHNEDTVRGQERACNTIAPIPSKDFFVCMIFVGNIIFQKSRRYEKNS